ARDHGNAAAQIEEIARHREPRSYRFRSPTKSPARGFHVDGQYHTPRTACKHRVSRCLSRVGGVMSQGRLREDDDSSPPGFSHAPRSFAEQQASKTKTPRGEPGTASLRTYGPPDPNCDVRTADAITRSTTHLELAFRPTRRHSRVVLVLALRRHRGGV